MIRATNHAMADRTFSQRMPAMRALIANQMALTIFLDQQQWNTVDDKLTPVTIFKKHQFFKDMERHIKATKYVLPRIQIAEKRVIPAFP